MPTLNVIRRWKGKGRESYLDSFFHWILIEQLYVYFIYTCRKGEEGNIINEFNSEPDGSSIHSQARFHPKLSCLHWSVGEVFVWTRFWHFYGINSLGSCPKNQDGYVHSIINNNKETHFSYCRRASLFYQIQIKQIEKKAWYFSDLLALIERKLKLAWK